MFKGALNTLTKSEFVHHIVLVQAWVVEGGLDCHSLRAVERLPREVGGI